MDSRASSAGTEAAAARRRGRLHTKEQYQAYETICRAWKAYRDRVTFVQLKSLILRSEYSLTKHLMKRLTPKELHLLKDPMLQARVRFRFGGKSFPPHIYYKIYSKGLNVHYFSGRQLIEPGSLAAVDACARMGNAKYHETVLLDDMILENSYQFSDAKDVTNKMEYVKYVNSLDTRPAHLGGRNNGWRVLEGYPLLDSANVTHTLPGDRRGERRQVTPKHVIRRQVVLHPPAPAPRPNPLRSQYKAPKPKASRKKKSRVKEKSRKIAQLRKLYGLDHKVSPSFGDEDDDDDDDDDNGNDDDGDEEIEEEGDLGRQASRRQRDMRQAMEGVDLHRFIENEMGDDEEFGELFEWTSDLSLDVLEHQSSRF